MSAERHAGNTHQARDILVQHGSMRRWTKALLNIGVSIPIALAPLLGRAHVPGFTSLLSLIPNDIQPFAVAVGAAAMSLVAASVAFREIGNASKRRLLKSAKKSLIAASILLALLALAYSHLVTRVSYDLAAHHRSYVTGFVYPREEPCKGNSIDTCIKLLDLQEGKVKAFFGENQVNYATDLLIGFYAGFFAVFGNLVGILVTLEQDIEGKVADYRPRSHV